MTIFNTSFMALDITMLAFHSLFKKGKKIVYVCILCPIVYLIAMLPSNLAAFLEFSRFVSVVGLTLGIVIPILLFLIAKMRGVKANG